MRARTLCLILGLCLPGASARAGDPPAALQLTIRDHRFVPAEIEVPAGAAALILVVNEDPAPEEVESKELQIEKVVPANATSKIRLRPLAPGRYPFFGEYHPDTAQGAVVVK